MEAAQIKLLQKLDSCWCPGKQPHSRLLDNRVQFKQIKPKKRSSARKNCSMLNKYSSTNWHRVYTAISTKGGMFFFMEIIFLHWLFCLVFQIYLFWWHQNQIPHTLAFWFIQTFLFAEKPFPSVFCRTQATECEPGTSCTKRKGVCKVSFFPVTQWDVFSRTRWPMATIDKVGVSCAEVCLAPWALLSRCQDHVPTGGSFLSEINTFVQVWFLKKNSRKCISPFKLG